MDRLLKQDVTGYIVKYNERYIGAGRVSAYDVYDTINSAQVWPTLVEAVAVIASGKRWKNGTTARWTVIEV